MNHRNLVTIGDLSRHPHDVDCLFSKDTAKETAAAATRLLLSATQRLANGTEAEPLEHTVQAQGAEETVDDAA